MSVTCGTASEFIFSHVIGVMSPKIIVKENRLEAELKPSFGGDHDDQIAKLTPAFKKFPLPINSLDAPHTHPHAQPYT